MAAPALRGLRARSAAMRVQKWLRGDDHGDAAGDVRQAEVEQRVALLVGQQELLGEVREDADAVDALVDHAVEHPAHARRGRGRRLSWKGVGAMGKTPV